METNRKVEEAKRMSNFRWDRILIGRIRRIKRSFGKK